MSHKPKKEDEIPVALALFEPPDPTKKPMYCKHLVYQGVTEFQFEELRAARYRQKVAREEVNQVIIMISQENNLLNDYCAKMVLGLFGKTWWRFSSYSIVYRGR